jgi:tetratricopeptide (TPR) repeat protein
MPNPRQANIVPFIFALLILAGGCAQITEENRGTQSPPTSQNSIDSSCAYFYFLRGSQAEYAQHFDEALNAYQKAVVCDPTANYISEKIPILLIKMGKLQEAERWLQTFVAAHPDENSQRLLLAEINIHIGNLPEAIRLYREAEIYTPDNESVFLRLGLLFNQQKDYKQAEDIFNALLKKNEKSYFANLYLARIFNQTGTYEQAANKYETALTLNWSKELVLEMADFFSRYRNYDKALTLYKSILATDKTDEQASLGMIQTYLSMDVEKQALAELSRLRSFSKHPEKIDLIESQIYLSRGKPAMAEKLLISIIKKRRSSQAEYLLALVYLDEKKPDKALGVLKDIGPKSDEYENSLFLQVRILRDTKRLDQALVLLQKIIADKTTRKPIYYALLSSLYQEIADMQQGLNALTEGIGLYPDNTQLLFELVILLEKTSRHEQAMTTADKVLQLQPNHPEALNFIGYSWADENKNLDKALEYIKRAVAQKPDNGFIHDSLGWVYYRLGDFSHARVELEKAVSLEPQDPHISDHLGDTYRALAQKDKALEVYTKALELFSEENEKVIVQKKIDSLKNL